jgi:hypothetical protein
MVTTMKPKYFYMLSQLPCVTQYVAEVSFYHLEFIDLIYSLLNGNISGLLRFISCFPTLIRISFYSLTQLDY